MWDAEDDVARYEAWYQTPKGSFALARERCLISSLISGWPRRGQTLLEVGCGAGHFLEHFYSAGFDVTGLDSSGPMLNAARLRMGSKATLRIGSAARMPFDDGEFDFSAMITSLECMDEPEAAMREAFRVASKGVLILFLNSWSLYRFEQILRERRARRSRARDESPDRAHALERARWYNLARMVKIVYAVSGKRPSCVRSVLLAPSSLWRGNRITCLPAVPLLPFGAVVGIRVDIAPTCVTPLVVPSAKVLPVAQ